jgi:pimeloyl-ACP methyl ester carboxylesterase
MLKVILLSFLPWIFLVMLSIYLAVLAPTHPVIPSEALLLSPDSKFVRIPSNSDDLGGRLLEYQTCGLGTLRFPVVATHGFGSTSGAFTGRSSCSAFKKLGLDVISLTQPGFGFSDSLSRWETREFMLWGQDVDEVLRQEGISKRTPLYVLGASAGGCPHALGLMLYYGSRVLGGILISPPTPPNVKVSGAEPNPTSQTLKALLGSRFIGDVLALVLSKVIGSC